MQFREEIPHNLEKVARILRGEIQNHVTSLFMMVLAVPNKTLKQVGQRSGEVCGVNRSLGGSTLRERERERERHESGNSYDYML